MVTPYDVSTVVSRSYIAEQVQDSMQKGQELKNVAFLAEYQKDYEKKKNEVSKLEKVSTALVCDKSVKMEDEYKKKKRHKKSKRYKESDETNNHNSLVIDIKV